MREMLVRKVPTVIRINELHAMRLGPVFGLERRGLLQLRRGPVFGCWGSVVHQLRPRNGSNRRGLIELLGLHRGIGVRLNDRGNGLLELP